MRYSFNTDYSLKYPLPACAKANPPCSATPGPPILFKKGDIIEGEPIGSSIQCIKAPCPQGLPTHVSSSKGTIPISVLSPVSSNAKSDTVSVASARDAWTGGVEWDKVFSLKNLFWLVVLVYLAYLFMKHVLPLAKKSFS